MQSFWGTARPRHHDITTSGHKIETNLNAMQTFCSLSPPTSPPQNSLRALLLRPANQRAVIPDHTLQEPHCTLCGTFTTIHFTSTGRDECTLPPAPMPRMSSVSSEKALVPQTSRLAGRGKATWRKEANGERVTEVLAWTRLASHSGLEAGLGVTCSQRTPNIPSSSLWALRHCHRLASPSVLGQ